MEKNLCPRCAGIIADSVLYKCVRCFTVYCKSCQDTDSGKLCPKCRMSQRLIISLKEK